MGEKRCYLCRRTTKEFEDEYYELAGIDPEAEKAKYAPTLEGYQKDLDKAKEDLDRIIQREIEIDSKMKDLVDRMNVLFLEQSDDIVKIERIDGKLIEKYGAWTIGKYESALDCDYPFEDHVSEIIKDCLKDAEQTGILKDYIKKYKDDLVRKTEQSLADVEENGRNLELLKEDKKKVLKELFAMKDAVRVKTTAMDEAPHFEPVEAYTEIKVDIQPQPVCVYICPICKLLTFSQANVLYHKIDKIKGEIDTMHGEVDDQIKALQDTIDDRIKALRDSINCTNDAVSDAIRRIDWICSQKLTG